MSEEQRQELFGRVKHYPPPRDATKALSPNEDDESGRRVKGNGSPRGGGRRVPRERSRERSRGRSRERSRSREPYERDELLTLDGQEILRPSRTNDGLFV